MSSEPISRSGAADATASIQTSLVHAAALAVLAENYTPRPARPLGSWDLDGHIVKVYSITAPARSSTSSPALIERARALTTAQLAVDNEVGSLGLAVLIIHLGGDGDYLILQTWIEAYMSRLTVFTGPAGQPHLLRPAPTGLAPCVWELAVVSHERGAFERLLTAPDINAALPRWISDTLDSDRETAPSAGQAAGD